MYKQILIAVFIIYIFLCIRNVREDFSVDKTFTSTDEWGSRERELLDKITEYGEEVLDSLPDKPPPSNDSETTKDEIETIKQLRRQMNDERQREINNELYSLLDALQGQLLHAETIEFIHPTKNKWVKFKSELPKDFKKMIGFLENVDG